MLLYKVTNKINGKRYIGQTIMSLAHRWWKHVDDAMKRKSRGVLSKAIRKYGADNFILTVIARCDNMEELNSREIYYIKLFNTLAPNGYNLDSGGHNKKLHPNTIKLLSERFSGEGNPMYGKSELMKEIQNRPEVKAKKKIGITKFHLRCQATGYIYPTPLKGTHNYWENPEKAAQAKLKMSQNHCACSGADGNFYGKKHSTESLQKMSESHRNRPKATCPHCQKIGDVSNMKRWHFDNCKHRI